MLERALRRAEQLRRPEICPATAAVLKAAVKLYEFNGFARRSGAPCAARCDAAYALRLY